MNMYLETDRLYMRPFQEQDAPHLFAMYNDPQVMRYTGDVPFKSIEQALQFVKEYESKLRQSVDVLPILRLAAVRKEDDAFIGWAGFKYHPQAQFTDMGYRLMKGYWGQGYGTELVKRVIQHGFEDHCMQEIIAHVHEDNIGSQRVVEKAGMQLLHKFLWSGKVPSRHYQISYSSYDNQTNNC